MKALEAARVLREMALLETLGGGNPFRSRAYEKAARLLEGWKEETDLAELLREGGIARARGVGAGILAVLEDLARGETPPSLEELRFRVPPGVVALVGIPGLGPGRVKRLWKELGVASPADLEYACLENRIARLKGFGPKLQEKIREGLGFLRASQGRLLLSQAREAADRVEEILLSRGGAVRVSRTGSLRRGMETVGDVDLLVLLPPGGVPGDLEKALEEEGFEKTGEKRGGTSLQFRKEGLDLDLQVADPGREAFQLFWATGSKAHLEAMGRALAAKEVDLSPEGLFREGRILEPASEEEIYALAGLPWIPPELREGREEFRIAGNGEIVLVEAGDLRGTLHCHTKASDGKADLEEMARAAGRMGMEWLGISDHSAFAAYAGGLDGSRLEAQAREILSWNRARGGEDPLVLHGIEADILPDGGVDLGPEVLAGLDFVIGSVHSVFGKDEAAMTGRIVKALESGWVDILGHPTGRLLLGRPAYPLDQEAVLRAAARAGAAVEINANPHRLDLDWRLHGLAVELGVPLVLAPDAHRVSHLEYLEYGIICARKGGLRPENLLNTLGAEEFLSWVEARRKKLGLPGPARKALP